MKVIDGNILDMKNGYICHQVNCKGVMGGGLAKEVKEKFPKVYEEYKEKVKNRKGSLLGDIQLIKEEEGRIFVNMFSQDDCGCVGQFTNDKAFEECLAKMKEEFNENLDVFFPYGIGCGLGGGNWNTISGLLEKYFPNATIVKL